jgi:hypothetical protein
MSYDLDRWIKPVFEFSGLSEFINDNLNVDGIYRIKMMDGKYLDLMIANTCLLNHTIDSIGVCMTGAVFPRNGRLAPFFSGLSILQDSNCLVISISDPSLSLSEKLSLGWYLGYKGNTSVPEFIATLLDLLSSKYKTKVVLYGGSGGGFASLLVSSLMHERVNVLVWNPQTSVSQYKFSAVKQYCKEAFDIELDEECKDLELFNILDSLGIQHCLYDIKFGDNVNVLYLQNSTDEHTFLHMVPLLKGNVECIGGISIYSGYEGKINACIGNWGDGHAVPPKSIISKALQALIRNENIIHLLSTLINDIGALDYDKLNSCFFGNLKSNNCIVDYSESLTSIGLGISDRSPINGASVTYRINFFAERAAKVLIRFNVVFGYYNPRYIGRIKYSFGSNSESIVIDSSLWIGRESFLIIIPSGVDKYFDITISAARDCEDWNWGKATALLLQDVSIEETKMAIGTVEVFSTHPYS